jgi:hypothetical protein
MYYVRKNAIKIQKTFRGYRLRKKLKVFKELPWELWNRVLYYYRYQHHIQHNFKNSISRIYNNKILDCDEDVVQFHLNVPDEEYYIIILLRTYATRGYYILVKNDVLDMFRKYSMVLY